MSVSVLTVFILKIFVGSNSFDQAYTSSIERGSLYYLHCLSSICLISVFVMTNFCTLNDSQ